MPLLATWLMGLVSGITGWLTQFVTKKIALGAALGTVLVGGWVALQLAVYGLWSAIGFVMPPFMGDVMKVVLYMLPSNAFACMNALIAARLLTWAWREQKDYAKAVSFIT